MEENTASFDISSYTDQIDFASIVTFVGGAAAGIVGVRLAFKGIDLLRRAIGKL